MSFVAKQAFDHHAITRPLMRRLGVAFVDADGEALAELDGWAERVGRGEVLVVFVEGTFVRAAGLRPFKLGAFDVAARATRHAAVDSGNEPVAGLDRRTVVERWFGECVTHQGANVVIAGHAVDGQLQRRK